MVVDGDEDGVGEEDIGEDVVVVVGEEDGVVIDDVDGDGIFIILAINMRYNKTMIINTTRAIIAIVSLSILLKMKIHISL